MKRTDRFEGEELISEGQQRMEAINRMRGYGSLCLVGCWAVGPLIWLHFIHQLWKLSNL